LCFLSVAALNNLSGDKNPFDFEEQDDEQSDNDIYDVMNFRDPIMEKHKNISIQQPISNDVTMDNGMDSKNMNDSNYFNNLASERYFIEIDESLMDDNSEPDELSVIGQMMFNKPPVAEYIPWKLAKTDFSQSVVPQSSPTIQANVTIPSTCLNLNEENEESVTLPPPPPKETHIEVLSSIKLSSSEIDVICRPASYINAKVVATENEVLPKLEFPPVITKKAIVNPIFPITEHFESIISDSKMDTATYGLATHIITEDTVSICNKVPSLTAETRVNSSFPIAGTNDFVRYVDNKNWMTGTIEWDVSQLPNIQRMVGSMNPPNPGEYKFYVPLSPSMKLLKKQKLLMEQPIRCRDERLLCRHYAKGRYSRLLNKFNLKRN
jgi:hypothetical protein